MKRTYLITERYNLSKAEGKRRKKLTNVSKQMNTWSANHNYIFRKYFYSLEYKFRLVHKPLPGAGIKIEERAYKQQIIS